MGEGRRFVLFGHPVGHSVSPAMHAAAIGALGLAHTYEALDIASRERLDAALEQLRAGVLSGANVTIPYKRVVLDRVNEVWPSAAEVGAANVICRSPEGRLIAHNTDARALSEEIAELRAGSKASRAAVIGAGGAGLAAIAACKMLGFTSISVTARSWDCAESLRQHSAAQQARKLGAVPCMWPKSPDPAHGGECSRAAGWQWRQAALEADVIIQATSAGMTGGDPGAEVSEIVPWSELSSDVLAYDVVYHPRETRFVRDATERGIQAMDGLGMLVRQAALSFALWTGIVPPKAVMRAAAEHSLRRGGGS